jgi:hypothetical protein
LRVLGVDLGSFVQQEASRLRVRVGCCTVQRGLTWRCHALPGEAMAVFGRSKVQQVEGSKIWMEWVWMGYTPLRSFTGWWLTYPSEKWWSSSVGMMKFPIHGKITNVPNHHPALSRLYCF